MNRKRSSESDFFSEKWKIVDETIDSIFRCGPLRYSFQVVYHSVFLLCQEKCQNSLVEHVDDALQMEVKKQVDQLLSLDSNFCMRELTARWSQFKKSLGKVGGVMLYLDQNYLCDYHRPSVRDRGEQFFCSVVLENSSVIARLRQAVMESVANNVHLDELKVLAHELGKIEQGSFYELLVESPYLSVMTQRCAVESQVHCRGDSIGEFLNWAFVHIEHELDFAGDHLAEESYQKVESALYQSIFGENIEFVLSINGLPKLFRMLDFDSIRRIGKAYAQINNLSPLVEKLRDSIRAEADRILCTNLELSPNAVGEIVLLQQNTDTLCELFNLINENSGLPIKRGLESAVGSCSGFVDALVSFFDHSIRQITKHQLNSLFDDVLKLIRIVKDKDVFEITFRNHMAARLLQTKRGGLQLERLFVERMKVESGSLSVSRLERMIEDFDRSSKLSGSWQSDLRSNGEIMPLDFHCSVLSEGSWPHYPNVSFSIPSSMQLCITQFQNFYLLRHNGRKLTFQMSLGTVEFQLSMQNRVYCVSALTPFSRTIELLNSDDAFSVDSASSFSMLSRTELQGQIAALRQTGLVVDSGNGLYSFNREFSSSKSTVRVSSASQKPTTENVDGSLKSQKGATRSDSLDCVIVKILKEHKALPHESLCKNVMSALRHIFSPSVGDIKARIQVLIDKGYIARGERNGCYMFCE